MATFEANWDAIVREMTTPRQTGKAVTRTMDLYKATVNGAKAMDPWPSDGSLGSVSGFEVYKVYQDKVNGPIHASSTKNDVPVARVHEAYNGPNGDEDPWDKGYISFDELRPNDRGREVIAKELRKLDECCVVGEA